MAIVMSTERKELHHGMVRFAFLSAEGHVVYANTSYTRADAAVVYDYLREKYPEHKDLKLSVEVVGDLNSQHQATVYQRGLMQKPIVTAEGEPFHAAVSIYGPRPRLKYPGRGVVRFSGEGGTNQEAWDKLANAIEVLETPTDWRKAAPLDQWEP